MRFGWSSHRISARHALLAEARGSFGRIGILPSKMQEMLFLACPLRHN
jgi:hypothetical protein